jgi:hypothetical protein
MFQNSYQNGTYFDLFDPKRIPRLYLSGAGQAEASLPYYKREW